MGKIIHKHQEGLQWYPSAIELQLDSNEKIMIGNSTSGIKIYEFKFIIPKVVWRCDNPSLIERYFPLLKTDFMGSPLEQIAKDILNRFQTKDELLTFLVNFESSKE